MHSGQMSTEKIPVYTSPCGKLHLRVILIFFYEDMSLPTHPTTSRSPFTTASSSAFFHRTRGIASVSKYNETNVMHFSFILLRIKSLYMFRALIAHPQEALHKRHLVYCVRIMSVGCSTTAVSLQSCTYNRHMSAFLPNKLKKIKITYRFLTQFRCIIQELTPLLI
jgi:hypothetical protein